MGLEVIPVVADNGEIGGKKSEEFMVLSDIGEDTILYDEKTGVALNIEVLEKENYKEYLKNEYGIEDISELKPRKAVELGHIFQLGKSYSENMKARYKDSDGKEKPFYMGCYGIGVSRTLATIYEKSIVKDKEGNPIGISLPCNLAPYFIQIIPKAGNLEKEREAEELYRELTSKGVCTILDDRKDTTIGKSIKDALILGTPYLAILGDKVKSGEVEIESTKTGQKITMPMQDLLAVNSNKCINREEEVR